MIENIIKSCLDKRKTRVLLSLGSHKGYPEVPFFLKNFPNAKIYCFEPDPRNLKYLSNFKSDRCEIYPVAIADHDGMIDFFQSYQNGVEDFSDSSSIHFPTGHIIKHPHVLFKKDSITVKCTTLDSWSSSNGIESIDLIWADLQGAEGDLIRGGMNILRATSYLYTEYSLDSELYESQMLLPEIMNALPFFTQIYKEEGNVLLQNIYHNS
jgi:FkbM family methyltransferase